MDIRGHVARFGAQPFDFPEMHEWQSFGIVAVVGFNNAESERALLTQFCEHHVAGGHFHREVSQHFANFCRAGLRVAHLDRLAKILLRSEAGKVAGIIPAEADLAALYGLLPKVAPFAGSDQPCSLVCWFDGPTTGQASRENFGPGLRFHDQLEKFRAVWVRRSTCARIAGIRPHRIKCCFDFGPSRLIFEHCLVKTAAGIFQAVNESLEDFGIGIPFKEVIVEWQQEFAPPIGTVAEYDPFAEHNLHTVTLAWTQVNHQAGIPFRFIGLQPEHHPPHEVQLFIRFGEIGKPFVKRGGDFARLHHFADGPGLTGELDGIAADRGPHFGEP